MRKQTINPNPTSSSIELGRQYLKTNQIEAAFSLMQETLTARQLTKGAGFSFPNQLLWCEILIAKSRFSGNPSYAALAITKLEEMRDLLPKEVNHPAPIPLTTLQTKANILLNNVNNAQQLAQQLSLFSKTQNNTLGSIEAYHLLSEIALKKEDFPTALLYARKGQELLLEETAISPNVVMTNYLLLSQVLYFQQEYDQSQHYLEKVLATAQDATPLEEYLIRALLWSALCAKQQKEYATAIQLLLEAKKRSQKIQHIQLAHKVAFAIGTVYNAVSDYSSAIHLFAHINEDNQFFLNDRRTNLLFHVEWGKAYYYAQQYHKAKPLFEKVIQSANGSSHQTALVTAFAYLSCIAQVQQVIPKALKLAKQCNEVIEKLDRDVDGSQVNLINLGTIHFQLGKYNEAIKLTSRGIATAKRLKDELSEIKGFQLMAKIFQQQKDFKNAFLYQSIYTKFYTDFFVKNDRQVVRDLEHAFELEQLRNDE